MKRIVTLLLAAGLVLGAAAGSQAADIKAKGIWQNNLSWADRAVSSDNNGDYFRASTRLPDRRHCFRIPEGRRVL